VQRDVALRCSVKDRIAYNMIRIAEERGLISPERTTLVCGVGVVVVARRFMLNSACHIGWPARM
jgi:cysteine synthase